MPRMPRMPSQAGAGRQQPPERIDPPEALGIGLSTSEGGAAPGSGARGEQAVDLRTVASAPIQPSPSFHGPLADWPAYWWLAKAQVPFGYRDLAPVGRAFGGPDQQGRPMFVIGDRARPLVIEVVEPTSSTRAALERQAGITRTASLRAAGYTVVGVKPEHLQSELGDTMTAALAGIQRFSGMH